MNFIVLLQNNIRIPVNEREAAQIAAALTKGAKVYHLERTQEFITLRPAPSILRSETLEGSEQKKKGRYKCGANEWHDWGERCTCFEKLPTITDLYPGIFAPKTIPQLTYNEELEARAEAGEGRAAVILRKERQKITQ